MSAVTIAKFSIKMLIDRVWMYADIAFQFLIFTVSRWVVYAVVVVGGLLTIETIILQETEGTLMFHAFLLLESSLALSLSVVMWFVSLLTTIFNADTVYTVKATTMFIACVRAIIGHAFVFIADAILTPILAVFTLFQMLFESDFSIMDKSKMYDSNGNIKCDSNGYPRYELGMIYGVGWVLDLFIKILDFKPKICLDQIGLGWIPIYGDECGTLNVSISSLFDTVISSATAGNITINLVDHLKNLQTKSLIPTEAFEWITNQLDSISENLFGNYSGKDLLHHYIIFGGQKLDFSSDGSSITTEGSHPFDNYLEGRVEGSLGC